MEFYRKVVAILIIIMISILFEIENLSESHVIIKRATYGSGSPRLPAPELSYAQYISLSVVYILISKIQIKFILKIDRRTISYISLKQSHTVWLLSQRFPTRG